MQYQINLKRELIFTGSCEFNTSLPTSFRKQKSDMLQSSTDLHVYCHPCVEKGKLKIYISSKLSLNYSSF